MTRLPVQVGLRWTWDLIAIPAGLAAAVVLVFVGFVTGVL